MPIPKMAIWKGDNSPSAKGKGLVKVVMGVYLSNIVIKLLGLEIFVEPKPMKKVF